MSGDPMPVFMIKGQDEFAVDIADHKHVAAAGAPP